MMNHYVTPDNQRWGFDETQADLIPKDAVLIPDTYTMEQIPYITLVDGEVFYDSVKHDADIQAIEAAKQAALDAKQAAESKLAKLGLTPDDLKALLG